MRTSKIEFYRGEDQNDQPYRWRFKGRNGENMASGEGYSSPAARYEAIETMKREFADAPIVDLEP